MLWFLVTDLKLTISTDDWFKKNTLYCKIRRYQYNFNVIRWTDTHKTQTKHKKQNCSYLSVDIEIVSRHPPSLTQIVEQQFCNFMLLDPSLAKDPCYLRNRACWLTNNYGQQVLLITRDRCLKQKFCQKYSKPNVVVCRRNMRKYQKHGQFSIY